MGVQPTVLLDNNAMSHVTVPQCVYGKTLYLPDVVFYELFAQGEWERSITSCLAPLAPFADQVVGTVSLSELLKRELGTGEPTESIAAGPDLNKRLRPILIACRDEPEKAIAYFKETQAVAPDELALRMALLAGSRELSVDTINCLKREVGEKSLSKFCGDPESIADYLRSINILDNAIAGFRLLPAGAGFECLLWNADRMASMPCCWMRFYLADLCLAFRRAAKKSFEQTSDRKLHADQNDREIVIMGSYADELLTFDRGAVWLDKALRACLNELF